MSFPLVPDELWNAIDPLLPRERPKRQGGRPRIPDRAGLAGIIFVFQSGNPWNPLPVEFGLADGTTCETGRRRTDGKSTRSC